MVVNFLVLFFTLFINTSNATVISDMYNGICSPNKELCSNSKMLSFPLDLDIFGVHFMSNQSFVNYDKYNNSISVNAINVNMELCFLVMMLVLLLIRELT